MPGSTPIVGRTAFRPEVTRAGADQVVPSVEREKTTSFAVQPGRKRQSCQTASTRPFGVHLGGDERRRPEGPRRRASAGRR